MTTKIEMTAEILEEKLKTYYFEMFSKEGEEACRSIVKKMFRKLNGKYRLTREDIIDICSTEIKKVSKKFPEVYDTEPTMHIADLVKAMSDVVGYNHDITRWDIC